MPKPLERGRNQVLYNYGPGKVFYHEKSGMIERILAIKQDARSPDLRVNVDQLRRRVMQEIHWYASADLEPNLVRSVPIHLTQPDYVISRAHPMAYYCQRCGHLYVGDVAERTREPLAELRTAVPNDRRCTCSANPQGTPCRGRLVQYDYLTTHNCGEEIFVPAMWFGKCRRHGAGHLHWIRQGSERAARWSIVCRVDYDTPTACQEAMQANDAFFAKHRNCPLENRVQWTDSCKATFSTAPFMKATHYMPRVVNLLNSDSSLQQVAAGTRDALVAAAGCLGDRGAFQRYDPNAGFDTWAQFYAGDAAANSAGGATLEELNQRLQFFETHLPSGPEKSKIVADLKQQISELATPRGPAVSPADLLPLANDDEYARQVRDTTLYLDRNRSIGFDDLLATSQNDPEYASQIQQAKQGLANLGIANLRYQERVPLTTALIGYVRGAYNPTETKLNLFLRQGGDGGMDVFASQTHTEAIWVQLDPTATLRWLGQQTAGGPAPTGNNAQDLFALQQRYVPDEIGLFGEVQPGWTAKHYGLLHSISHLFIKAAGRVTGLTQEGVSEEILPYTNSFLIYANQSGEFTLGGLQLMMEYHMASVLSGLRDDAHRCPFNPVCEKKHASCPGCLHLAEVSCASFNRVLNRTLLIDPTVGYWRIP